MRISEIFTSLQGEGPEIGKPTVFVRLTGCNLHCIFCDTPYALHKGKQISVKKLVKMLKKSKIKHITWTGGEPSLQYKEIKEVVRQLGYEFQHSIETNGTVLFNPWPFQKIIISPKKEYVKPEVIRWLFGYAQKSYLKFVVGNKEDFTFWWDFVEDERLYQQSERIYFMPEGIDNDTLHKKSLWLVEECKKKGVNFSPRLQIWLWSNRKGV